MDRHIRSHTTAFGFCAPCYPSAEYTRHLCIFPNNPQQKVPGQQPGDKDIQSGYHKSMHLPGSPWRTRFYLHCPLPSQRKSASGITSAHLFVSIYANSGRTFQFCLLCPDPPVWLPFPCPLSGHSLSWAFQDTEYSCCLHIFCNRIKNQGINWPHNQVLLDTQPKQIKKAVAVHQGKPVGT